MWPRRRWWYTRWRIHRLIAASGGLWPAPGSLRPDSIHSCTSTRSGQILVELPTSGVGYTADDTMPARSCTFGRARGMVLEGKTSYYYAPALTDIQVADFRRCHLDAPHTILYENSPINYNEGCLSNSAVKHHPGGQADGVHDQHRRGAGESGDGHGGHEGGQRGAQGGRAAVKPRGNI